VAQTQMGSCITTCIRSLVMIGHSAKCCSFRSNSLCVERSGAASYVRGLWRPV